MLLREKRIPSIDQLVNACQRNERWAQSIFYDRYKKRMLALCCGYARTNMEAEDILNEAFLKVLTNIHQLKDAQSLDGWVKTIVTRTAINHYNRAKGKEYCHVSIENVSNELESADFEKIMEYQDSQALSDSIDELPSGARAVFSLYFYEGYTHVQIAETLFISISTSKSQLWRGKRMLIKKLRDRGISQI